MSENQIVYEDNHLIVINKQSGELVQGDKTGDKPLSEAIALFIKQRDSKPGNVFLGVIHRLDRPVSGVCIFAKTSKALSRMNELFRKDEIKKVYWAIVKNRPEKEEGVLHHYLVRNEKQNKSYAHPKPTTNSKEAKLRYKLLAASDSFYLLEVELITGRHHQIRCQLAAMGCPIKGDLKYGYPRSNVDGGISLHARCVEFIHPIKQELLSITAATPASDKLWSLFKY